MPNNNLCKLSGQQIIIIVAGAIIYGLLSWLDSTVQLPAILIVTLKLAVVVPIFCGLIGGSVVGFLVGFLGSILADVLNPELSFLLYWYVGSGLLGLIPGIGASFLRLSRSWQCYLLAELMALAGVYVSLDYLVSRQVIYEALPPASAWEGIFSPAFLNNSVSALILTPILLGIYHLLVGKKSP
jgi:uncharacterized membrane protein